MTDIVPTDSPDERRHRTQIATATNDIIRSHTGNLFCQTYTLADDASTVLPFDINLTHAFIEVVTSAGGGSSEWGMFSAVAGTPTLRAGSANVDDADTDTDVCVFVSSSQLVVRNRLGDSRDVTVKVIWPQG